MNRMTVTTLSLAVAPIDEATESRLAAILDEGERVRAARFVFEQDRRAYTAAHALLRHALSERAGVEPTAWRFAAGSHGKPYLSKQPAGFDLRFSLSHCRSMVAVAIAQGLEVGVDVEACGRAVDLEIANSCFAPDEIAMLNALPQPEQQRDLFTKLWTLKEAVIKATGAGLSQPLESFSIEFDPLRVTMRDCFDKECMAAGHTFSDPDSWSVACWRRNDHHIAVATRCSEGIPIFKHQEAKFS
jgi:4'-phosphopantetheinyl transferase